MPSSCPTNIGIAITAPLPFSCAPVTIVALPSPFICTYAPEGAGMQGHQPTATPIASSSGSSRP